MDDIEREIRDQKIVELRRQDMKSLREIGEMYGITGERVRQILQRNEITGRLLKRSHYYRVFRAVGVIGRIAYRETEPWHGTYQGYAYRHCRCDECVQAYRKRSREMRYKRYTKTPRVHNASSYLNYRCRCEICRAAWSKKNRDYRRRNSERLRAYYREYGRRKRAEAKRNA